MKRSWYLLFSITKVSYEDLLRKINSLHRLFILHGTLMDAKKDLNNDTYPLKDTCFVFTGQMSIDRDEARSKVAMLGGRVTTVPTRRTTHVVLGTNPGPEKVKKIKGLSVRTLDEKDFMRLIDRKSAEFQSRLKIDIEPVDSAKDEGVKAKCEIWSEKWRPKNVTELAGNQGIYIQLKDFLMGKTNFNAALLSGPPGIGKTTMAHVASRELNMRVVEFNASDTRSKNELQRKIKLGTSFCSVSGGDTKTRNKVLIMDEVDGMVSDKGGIGELGKIIKGTKIPIICICNDRYNQKIKALSYLCLDLRFRKLECRQIMPRLKYILDEEKIKIQEPLLSEVVRSSNCDFRYILNTIQNIVSRKWAVGSSHEALDFIKKSAMKNIFEISAGMFQMKKISEKIDIYFEDYSFVPLSVQENYLNLSFRNVSEVYMSADSISTSDLFEYHIRGPCQLWSLAPSHAFFGSILPTEGLFLNRRIEFPAYLGQNSRKLKNSKNLGTILSHIHKAVDTNKTSLRMYYLDPIFRFYVFHLCCGNINESLEVLKEYFLLKEDMDFMADLVLDGSRLIKSISTKNKSAFTRAYKKLHRVLPYSCIEESKEKRSLKEEDSLEDSVYA